MIFAILAAILWGAFYALSSKLVQTYSPAFLLVVNTIVSVPLSEGMLILFGVTVIGVIRTTGYVSRRMF